MQFAIALPWWVAALIVAAVIGTAWATYSGAIVPLSRARRGALVTLRALTLLLLVACLLRPVRVMPPERETDAVVPILVDASRSMRLADADGRARIDVARDVVARLQPSLAGRFTPEVWTFGRTVSPLPGTAPIAADG